MESGETTEEWGQYFDTISVCMSKGLGAPVGSLLLGTNEKIKEAKRFRKVMGGGMRQVGYLAAACDFALENNIPQLKVDNQRAKDIGTLLHKLNYIKELKPVQSNIVIFALQDDIKDQDFIQILKQKGILAVPFGDNTIRFVFHLDITDQMMEELMQVLPNII